MANLNIRIDDDLKATAETLCADMGMTVSGAVNIFLTQMVRTNGIPFEIKADPFYNAANLAHIADSLAQLKNGKVVQKSLAELENLANG